MVELDVWKPGDLKDEHGFYKYLCYIDETKYFLEIHKTPFEKLVKMTRQELSIFSSNGLLLIIIVYYGQ